jgi:hypothetical protein
MAKIWGDNNKRESKGLIQGKDLKSIIYKKDLMTRGMREKMISIMKISN